MIELFRALSPFGLRLVGLAAIAGLALLAPSAASGQSQVCPNQQIRSAQGATGLADCRAWEMVSPADKNGGDIWSGFSSRAARAGNRVVYTANTGFAGTSSALALPNYMASRTASGWSTRALSPPFQMIPGTGNPQSQVRAFSADLTSVISYQVPPSLDAGAQSDTTHLYVERVENGKPIYKAVTPAGPTGFGLFEYVPEFVSASADFSHIVYESAFAMTPDAVPGADNLYEWVDGQTRLVNLLPDGTAAPAGAAAGLYTWNYGALARGAVGYAESTVSRDGSRIFFTAIHDQQLYVRISGETTVQASRSQRTNGSGPGGTDPVGSRPVRYVGATPDGSKVFFTSVEKLTNDSTAYVDPDTGEAERPDLYEYDVDSGALTDLSVAAAAGPTDSADVRGVLGVSDDGEYVYFAALGVLAPGAVLGKYNIYLRHEGTVRHVASLDPGDLPETANWPMYFGDAGREKTSRVSPDGRTLLFRSITAQTAYSTNGHGQIYRYDAGTGDVQCLSCSHLLSSATATADLLDSDRAGVLFAKFLMRSMSQDGQRVFFNTAQRLVPSDINDRVDVYQWRDGQVGLISSGRSSTDSFFADADIDGDNVFFVTRESLVQDDVDENVDMYVARVDGGFSERSRNAPCVEDGCQGAPRSAPEGGVAGSGGLAREGESGRLFARLSLASVTAGARRMFAMGRPLRLSVQVGRTGMARAVARARVGGRSIVVARGFKWVPKAGTVRLSLRLSKAGRRQLAKAGRLPVTVRVSFGGVHRTVALRLTKLRRGGSR